ncbi:MAG: hypothetical protein ABW151_19185 [Pseudorhodoplanes sp.]
MSNRQAKRQWIVGLFALERPGIERLQYLFDEGLFARFMLPLEPRSRPSRMSSIDDLDALSGCSGAIRERSNGRARDRVRVRRRRLGMKHSGLRIPMWRHSAFHSPSWSTNS